MNNASWFRQHWVFLTVLMASLAARILFGAGQGFSNDELSALVRTRLNDWDTFWFQGVTYGDMHPVLYQALLWIWVRCFGEGEFVVRLPGILLFVFGHWMVYNTLKKYAHPYAAICFTAVSGSLGFLIMHSTFARPYNTGVFFLLLMCCVYIGVKKTGNISRREILLLGAGACGSMLSHYFAGLVAFIFLGFAFFALNNEHKKGIFISGLLGIVGFAPHVNATLMQLQKGGLQWLSPPDHRWLLDTFWLVLNESWIIVFLVLLSITLLILHFGLHQIREGFHELIMFFIVVVLIGFLISWFYTPILRDLVIVFLLPFLLLGVFGSISFNDSKNFNGLTLGFTAVLLTHSFLTYGLMGTHHFGVFKEIGQQINQSIKQRGAPNITFASNYNNIEYINYYLNTPLKEPIKDWGGPGVVEHLSTRITSSKKPFFCYSFNNAYDEPIFLEMARTKYPYVVNSYFTRGSHFVLFGNEKKGMKPGLKTLYTNKKKVRTSSEEFMMDVEIPLSSLLKGQAVNGYYTFECDANAAKESRIYLVSTVEKDGKQLIKNGQPLFYMAYDQSELVTKPNTFYTAFELPEDIDQNAMLHFYLWNPERHKLKIGSWSLKQVKIPTNK